MPQFIIETRFLPGDSVILPDGQSGEIVEFIYRRRAGHHVQIEEWRATKASDWNSYMVKLEDGSVRLCPEEDLDEAPNAGGTP
jgi:hypothetical protein